MNLLTHFFELFFCQLSDTCLFELFKSSSDSFITNKNSFTNFAGWTWQVMDFSCDQNSCTTQAWWSSSLAHPISFHSLNQFCGSHGNLSSLIPKVKHLAVSGNVDTWINKWKLVLETQKSEKFQETSGELEQVNVHFVAEIDQKIRLLSLKQKLPSWILKSCNKQQQHMIRYFFLYRKSWDCLHNWWLWWQLPMLYRHRFKSLKGFLVPPFWIWPFLASFQLSWHLLFLKIIMNFTVNVNNLSFHFQVSECNILCKTDTFNHTATACAIKVRLVIFFKCFLSTMWASVCLFKFGFGLHKV